jgi:ribosome modulation factor
MAVGLGTEQVTEKGTEGMMSHDEVEHHPRTMADEPSYEAGYRAGLAGEPTPLHFDVLLEQALWADGWHAGMAEAARRTSARHLGRPGLDPARHG